MDIFLYVLTFFYPSFTYLQIGHPHLLFGVDHFSLQLGEGFLQLKIWATFVGTHL